MPITTNAIMTGARGTFGKQVVFKKYGDKTVISSVPNFRNRKLSPKQLKNNETMAEAHYYAMDIIGEDNLRNEAQLRLNVQRNKLYTSLIREYYKNNYRVDEKESEAKVGAPVKKETNMPFITYLLENTDKSIEEISMLTNTPADVVKELKKSSSKS